jgi:hypothetical protein
MTIPQRHDMTACLPGHPLAWALMCLALTCTGIDAATEDGIYRVDRQGDSVGRIPDQAHGCSLTSADNANTSFMLCVRYPSSSVSKRSAYRLELATHQYPVFSTVPLGADTLFMIQLAAADVPLAERQFAIAAKRCHHPGYLIDGDFIPVAGTVHLGEPALVTMVLRNVGGKPFSCVRAITSPGARDRQLSFAASCDGQPLVAVRADDSGSYENILSLPPGGEYRCTVDVRSWCALDHPGIYRFLGSFSFWVQDPQTGATIWNDTLSRTCALTVLAAATNSGNGEAPALHH